jgi:lipoprotein-anchoring transpeptidase ErfK/SrfK
VRIYLAAQYADIFDGPNLIGRSSICSGRRSHRTPAGQYTVTEKIAEHVSNRYGDYVDETGQIVQANIDAMGSPPPPGTVFRGTKMPYFLRILGGIGLHAGPLPGYPDSHGCIRFPETIAQRLFAAATVGMPVLIED